MKKLGYYIAYLFLAIFGAIGYVISLFMPKKAEELQTEPSTILGHLVNNAVTLDNNITAVSELHNGSGLSKPDRYAARVLLLLQHDFVDPKKYGGWDGKLSGVKTDIKNLISYFLSRKEKWSSPNGKLITDKTADYLLKNKFATKEAFVAAASVIKNTYQYVPGKKLLFIGASGHGGQEYNGLDDDADKQAETHVLYNGQLRDDQVRELYAKTLGADWEIVWWIDRCHSGGMNRAIGASQNGVKTIKSMPNDLAKEVRFNLKDLTNINIALPKNEALQKYLVACKEEEYAMDLGAEKGGMFTFEALNVLKLNGSISYEKLISETAKRCEGDQTPQIANAKNEIYNEWQHSNEFLN